eukprot:TRINITY_DN85158_c0_g1_i1.p1 TRINITY_DN85158_c0_g1~~TRINITY_DN85158_c0_g1_i1.p1  ORF type:complete len:414 (-),score=66.33 TRINITY_DN85158_c0_g1_i1:5-1114(-)
MVAAGRGRILLVSSLAATAPGVAGAAAYASSKAFIRSFSSGLRSELQPAGVGVTCLMPGATEGSFARASGMERALCFNFPMARTLGIVLSAEEVARSGVAAVLNGDDECIPGLLNSVFSVLPKWLSGPLADAMFSDAPWLKSGPAFVAALSLFILLLPTQPASAFPIDDAFAFHTWQPALVVIAVLAGLIAWNIFENGSTETPDMLQTINSLEDVLAIRRKSDFIALWCSGKPPTSLNYGELAGKLLPLGVLWPSSWFITNFLFSNGRRWLGKALPAVLGDYGCNIFASGGGLSSRERRFQVDVKPSELDGRPALVLEYGAEDGDFIWGKVAGMRDELREVAPGILMGLGSMRITGGAQNCAPFVLYRK